MTSSCRCCRDDVRVLFVLVSYVISLGLSEAGTDDARRMVTTAEGSPVMLPCFVSTSSTGVSWTFKPSEAERSAYEDIYRNSRFTDAWSSRANIDPVREDDFSLILERVSVNDAGLYTCDARGEIAVTRRYLLTLSDSVEELLTLVDAECGQEVAFSCWLANASSIRWHHTLPEFPTDPAIVHNGRRPSQNYNATGRYHYYMDVPVHRSVLLINATEQSDAGTFKCSPSHTAVQAYWEFHLSFRGSNCSQPDESAQTPVPACSVGDTCNPTTLAVVGCIMAIVAATISVAVTCAYFRIWHSTKRENRLAAHSQECAPLEDLQCRAR